MSMKSAKMLFLRHIVYEKKSGKDILSSCNDDSCCSSQRVAQMTAMIMQSHNVMRIEVLH